MAITERPKVGTPRVITDDEFIAAFEAMLERRGGDFIYQIPDANPYDGPDGTCLYSTDEGATGSCGIGSVLIDDLGLRWDEHWEGIGFNTFIHDDYVDALGSLSKRVRAAATMFQTGQDAGYPYWFCRLAWDAGLAGTVFEFEAEALKHDVHMRDVRSD